MVKPQGCRSRGCGYFRGAVKAALQCRWEYCLVPGALQYHIFKVCLYYKIISNYKKKYYNCSGWQYAAKAVTHALLPSTTIQHSVVGQLQPGTITQSIGLSSRLTL